MVTKSSFVIIKIPHRYARIEGYAAGSMWLAFCISLLMWWERAGG